MCVPSHKTAAAGPICLVCLRAVLGLRSAFPSAHSVLLPFLWGRGCICSFNLDPGDGGFGGCDSRGSINYS